MGKMEDVTEGFCTFTKGTEKKEEQSFLIIQLTTVITIQHSPQSIIYSLSITIAGGWI